MMNTFFSEGLHFECRKCSGCCRGAPGFVYLSQQDLDAFVSFLQIPQEEFTGRYCRWVDLHDGREVLSLIEKKNFDCIFWEQEKGCSLYQVRPLQCRSYPFWFSVLRGGIESWNALSEHCPGINNGRLHTADEVSDWLEKREKQPYITRKVITGV